jgi:hypothetical protein
MSCAGPYEGSCLHALVRKIADEYCMAHRFTVNTICLLHSNFNLTRPRALYSDSHTAYDAVLHVAAVGNFRRNLSGVLTV